MDPQISKVIIRKTKGNPALALDYFTNMLQNGFAKVVKETGRVVPTYYEAELERKRFYFKNEIRKENK